MGKEDSIRDRRGEGGGVVVAVVRLVAMVVVGMIVLVVVTAAVLVVVELVTAAVVTTEVVAVVVEIVIGSRGRIGRCKAVVRRGLVYIKLLVVTLGSSMLRVVRMLKVLLIL